MVIVGDVIEYTGEAYTATVEGAISGAELEYGLKRVRLEIIGARGDYLIGKSTRSGGVYAFLAQNAEGQE